MSAVVIASSGVAAAAAPVPPPLPPPAALPLAAGAFSAVQADGSAVAPKKAVSNSSSCTTGFAVTKGGTSYLLTANHCREWTDKKGKRIGSFASVVNISSGYNPGSAMVWATKLTCDATGPRCLRPTGPSYPGDLMAWAPDPGTVTPVGEVFTTHGLQPVLGTAMWKKGLRVCRMGAQTGQQRCGKVGYFNQAKGLVYLKDADGGVAMAGDTGGPVYTYVRNPDGSVAGVNAVGMLEQSSRTRTYFYPIATIEAALGVQLVTS